MYWRKANHIHGWFVENVQDGSDDQRDYHIDPGLLQELFNVCTQVIRASKLIDGTLDGGTVCSKEHPNGLMQRIPGKVIENATVAKLMLPTCQGFFFGGTEYDEQYLRDVMDTRDWTARMLLDGMNGVPGDIYYSSSW